MIQWGLRMLVLASYWEGDDLMTARCADFLMTDRCVVRAELGTRRAGESRPQTDMEKENEQRDKTKLQPHEKCQKLQSQSP